MSLKVAIVGTGGFSRMHAKILEAMNGVLVSAFCGTSIEKAGQVANEFNANGYDNVDVMLDTEEVDALYICVPPYAHGKVEQAAIDRNIPFLVEKPLGVSDEEPRRLVEQIKRDNLITSVGYHFRYQNSVQQMKRVLQGERVGMLIGKWMGSMPEVAWWRDQKRSGGQFIEQTTHIVDLVRYVIGEVTDVYASYATTSIQKKYDGVSVADVGAVTLTLENGAVASINNTCVLPGHVSEVGLSVYTSNGLLEWNPERVSVKLGNEETDYDNEVNPYERESTAFLHAVQTGDRSKILSSYEDAYQTFKVTEAALRSAKSGERVGIRET
ncbi:Gfo/Idh/MocA family protein [Bacillus sp. JCM 19034]|uniref:Gfo/Idh/MocA family protein n=1 Tax=Bacillus sp. JCM 19034 TaxID=1481928 RepID=UPI0007833654|nr:Gfo/Idh/MocA family oxidoreductase [Bacillus sp. JCM 19034]